MLRIFISLLLVFHFSLYGEDFFDISEDNFKEDAIVAKEDGKKAIMIFFDMANCPFCAKMERTVLNQNDVVKYYKKNFAIFEVDINGKIEIADFKGKIMTQEEFANKNRVRATPVIAFFDLDGKRIFSRTGYTNKKEFLVLGQYIAQEKYKTENFVRYKRKMLKR